MNPWHNPIVAMAYLSSYLAWVNYVSIPSYFLRSELIFPLPVDKLSISHIILQKENANLNTMAEVTMLHKTEM